MHNEDTVNIHTMQHYFKAMRQLQSCYYRRMQISIPSLCQMHPGYQITDSHSEHRKVKIFCRISIIMAKIF